MMFADHVVLFFSRVLHTMCCHIRPHAFGLSVTVTRSSREQSSSSSRQQSRCVIWGSCGHVLLLNVHKMMKQYARVILNVKDKREVSTVTLFRTLGWLPIDVRIHYFTAVAMFNIMIGQAPVDLVNMFTQTNSVHDHNTRGGTNIRVKKYNLSICQRTFAYRGAKVWDNIPPL